MQGVRLMPQGAGERLMAKKKSRARVAGPALKEESDNRALAGPLSKLPAKT
jgi:hypothetical protein